MKFASGSVRTFGGVCVCVSPLSIYPGRNMTFVTITHQRVEQARVVPEPRVLSLQVLEGHLHQHSHVVPAHHVPLCTCRSDASELESGGQGTATGGPWVVSRARKAGDHLSV